MASISISYLIELKDKYTNIAKNVANSNKTMQSTIEKVKGSLEKVGSGFKNAQLKLKNFGSSMKSMGNGMTSFGKNLAGVSASVGAIFWKSLKNYQEQTAAIAQLDNSMKTRQQSLGITSKQIQDMASEMQGKSIFGDESIIQNVSNQLLSFDKVNGDVFKRANQSVLDMTSRLYGAKASAEQMKSISMSLGKALNNPAEAMNSLGTAGVKFTKSQQNIVKYLVGTGQSAKAQEYILQQLETRYKGSAEALGKTQPLTQLTNAFNDMLEPLGQIVQEFLVPLVRYGTQMIGVFNGLSKPVKTVIVAILGVITIASPLLIILGGVFSAIGQVTTGIRILNIMMKKQLITTKLVTAAQNAQNVVMNANPVMLAVVAIIALVTALVIAYKKSEKFREIVNKVWDGIKQVWDVFVGFCAMLWDGFISALQSVGEWLQGVWDKIVGFGQSIGELWQKMLNLLNPVIDFGTFIFMWLTPLGLVIQAVKLLVTHFTDVIKVIKKAAGVLNIFNKEKDKSGGVDTAISGSSASGGGSHNTTDINIQANPGTQVTKMKSKTTGNKNTGPNIVKK